MMRLLHIVELMGQRLLDGSGQGCKVSFCPMKFSAIFQKLGKPSMSGTRRYFWTPHMRNLQMTG
jgi:hypothetical protein